MLEIGTGSGFVRGLCELGREVTVSRSTPRSPAGRRQAGRRGCANVSVQVADALSNFVPQRTFDAIAVTGAVFSVPSAWRRGCRRRTLVLDRGESPVMEALLVTPTPTDTASRESLFETDLPYPSLCAATTLRALGHAQFFRLNESFMSRIPAPAARPRRRRVTPPAPRQRSTCSAPTLAPATIRSCPPPRPGVAVEEGIAQSRAALCEHRGHRSRDPHPGRWHLAAVRSDTGQ